MTSVLVSSLPPTWGEENLRALFGFAGAFNQVTLMRPTPTTLSAILKFPDAESARKSLLLDKTPFAIHKDDGTEMHIVMSVVPYEDAAAPVAAPLVPQPPFMPQLLGTIAQQRVALPPSQQRADQIARTIYIGNVSAQIVEEQLTLFFSSCGEINLVRYAGDTNHDTRFAFIEFTSTEAAQAALMLNGFQLAEKALKVSPAKGAIINPTSGPGKTSNAIIPQAPGAALMPPPPPAFVTPIPPPPASLLPPPTMGGMGMSMGLTGAEGGGPPSAEVMQAVLVAQQGWPSGMQR
ncbi:putative Splicing regulatory glutamine/lysine-rich protein 1 [Paratrimastix pyriformis]|uniref:Splicing regulatory glutamine/lysine-rich protein 1 n=1 Tax=Paratrimastix pyriformis TaxID=342808 RepID=A0ABQ8U535_9EUKA|nr:putative Splicing regulatory glutamine/lysine-rich protein 1 [Paratrimastix pyriformis]